MRNNIRIVLCVGLCIVGLTGCTGEGKYSEKEQEVLTAYMAQVVLEHTKGYDYRLVDVRDNPFVREEEDATSLAEDVSVVEKEEEDKVKTGSATEEVKEENQEEESDATLAEAFDFNKNIEVKVMKCSVVDDLSSGAYFLEADKGEKLVKVDLKLINTSDKDIKAEYKISTKCALVADGEEYNPLLTAFDNDLMFLSKKIKPGKSYTTSVIYSVDDKKAKKDKELNVTTNENSKTVKLD